MSRHDTLIIKDTHRGLLYEDGVLRDVLPGGSVSDPSPTLETGQAFFGMTAPNGRGSSSLDRGHSRTRPDHRHPGTADHRQGDHLGELRRPVPRVHDPRAAVHQVKNFEERLYSETQTAARRVLRGLSLEEVIASRGDEIGEETQRQVEESATRYGLAVTGLDFKDLIVPAELRKAMNRAALAKRLRQVQMAEGRHGEEVESADEEALAAATGSGCPRRAPIPDRRR